MKRKAAIVFIVLANFIILAHAVIPHHHHYEDFYSCHDNDCCNSSIIFSFSHEDEDCSHGDSEREACKLQDLLSKLVLNTKERESFEAALESDFQDYYTADICFVDVVKALEVVHVRYRQYNGHVPEDRVISFPSLRAPPCC